METILEKVKLSLRISNNVYDNELEDLINACKVDLEYSEITYSEPDDLIIQAIKLYCKTHFDNENMERYDKAYNDLKAVLKISGEYQNG